MCKQQNKHDGVSLESILFGASSLHPGFWQPETIVFGLENHKPTLSFNTRPKLLILRVLLATEFTSHITDFYLFS